MEQKIIEDIKEILDFKINNHQQGAEQVHNVIRKVNDVIFVFGEICGIAFILEEYMNCSKKEQKYTCVLLEEDDDYWYVNNNYVIFDPYWLSDFQKVMKDADEYYKQYILNNNDE